VPPSWRAAREADGTEPASSAIWKSFTFVEVHRWIRVIARLVGALDSLDGIPSPHSCSVPLTPANAKELIDRDVKLTA
jgi:hypothetical protein